MSLLRILIVVTFFLVSCTSEPETNTPGRLDNGKLSEISKSFCAVGEKLVELNLDPVPLKFEYLNEPGTLVAFIKGDGACAAEADILTDSWFGLKIHSQCLPNRSIWKFTDGYNVQDTRYYQLDSVDPSGLPTMDLWGAQTLNSKYIRDHAGLRVMKCTQTQN